MEKAVFLDRDGVLNQAIIKNGQPYPPASLNELIIPKEVPISLEKLRSNGYLLIVVTNQPDVARGTTTKTMVEMINNELLKSLPLDAIEVCYHDDKDKCNCRKPLPGLLLNAAKQNNVDLTKSFMIGDRWKDIEAGKNASCQTVWLNYQYKEPKPVSPSYTTFSLSDAVQWILDNKV